jgi:hypothetical protein
VLTAEGDDFRLHPAPVTRLQQQPIANRQMTGKPGHFRPDRRYPANLPLQEKR